MSENSTSNQKSELSQVGSWMGHHWVMIVMIIVGGLLVCGIIKVIISLFGGSGPLADGAGKLLGAGANVLNDLAKGCSKQGNCSHFSDQKSCEKDDTCGWSTDDKTSESTCAISSGFKEGEGGITDFKNCGLGLFALGGFILLIIGPLISAICNRIKPPESDIVKILALLKGESTVKTAENIRREVSERSENAESDGPMSDKAKTDLSHALAIDIVKELLKTETDSLPDAIDRANKLASGTAAIEKDTAKRAEDQTKDGLSNDEIARNDKIVDGKK
jgi:hypothetical protein